MRCLFVLAVPVVAVAVLFGYYFIAIPVHPEIEQPWLYRAFVGGNAIIRDAIRVYGLYTGGDSWRMFAEHFGRDFYPRRMGLSANLQESLETIAGVSVLVTRTLPTSGKLRPAVVYIHGGGFAMGSIYLYDTLTARLANETHAIIFNVDYRLSVESPSPSQIDDCYAVVMELYKTAGLRGVDRTQIFVAGDSAGGTLAAALALRLRDEEAPLKLSGQILLYPWLQVLHVQLPSYILNKDYNLKVASLSKMALLYHNISQDYVKLFVSNNHISGKTLEKYSDLVAPNLLAKDMIPSGYTDSRENIPGVPISEEFENAITNPYNWPLMEEDLTDLPATFILTIESDLVRDDGLLYARRLKDAGNDVIPIHERGGWHAMMSFMHPPMNVTAAHRVMGEMVTFMNTRIHPVK